MSLAIWPPAISLMRVAALFKTLTVLLMSTPFSKRVAASVRRPCFKEVLRTDVGLNHALSKKIFFVLAVTPLCIPPYTPPIHMGASVLHIIRSSANNFLSFSSSVTKGVPSGRFFMMSFLPVMASASKACSG